MVLEMIRKFGVLLDRKWESQGDHFEHQRDATNEAEAQKRLLEKTGFVDLRRDLPEEPAYEVNIDPMYELNIGSAKFGPFTSWRTAADLAVKMNLAVWSTRWPGSLDWFKPGDFIHLCPPFHAEKEEAQVPKAQWKKAVDGELGTKISWRNCNHSFPVYTVDTKVSTDGRVFPCIVAYCFKCGHKREVTL